MKPQGGGIKVSRQKVDSSMVVSALWRSSVSLVALSFVYTTLQTPQGQIKYQSLMCFIAWPLDRSSKSCASSLGGLHRTCLHKAACMCVWESSQ